MYYSNWNYFYQNVDDSYVTYTTSSNFNIRGYIRRKESLIKILKMEIYEETSCYEFDYFSKFSKRLQNISELELTIITKLQKEKNRPKSRVREVLDFLADSIIPQFKDTLEIITFYEVHIQEKGEKDEEQSIKKYLYRLLQPLTKLRTVSFRQTLRETKPADFYSLKQFISLLQENPSILPNLKLLDFEFRESEQTIKLKSMDQKELGNIMLKIAKDLAKINRLEELQIGVQNLSLEKNFFDFLLESICRMKQLKKIGLDISNNRITVENSVSNIKKLQALSNQLESFIYIDSQKFKPSTLKEYSQIMKSFQNLKFLQIEQMTFKKGQGLEFFSCLQNMPLLEDVRLDLDCCAMNEDDFTFFTKQLKSLKNLNSLYLTLPEEGQTMSINSIENLIDLLKSFQDQLIDVSIVFSSVMSYDLSVQFRDTICLLQNLKYFYIRFLNDRFYNNSITLDSRKSNVENIWNFKSLDFLLENYHFQNIIDVIVLLKYRILSSQKAETLEDLKIIQYSYPRNIEIQNEVGVEVKKMNKFTNLKSLINKSTISIPEFIATNQKIIENNISSLRYLTLSNMYSFKSSDMLLLVEKCKLLYYLDIQVDSISNDILSKIFTELVFLQSLNVNQNYFYQGKFDINPETILDANYLTEFQCTYSNGIQWKTLLQNRKVYILQYIIYSQLIMPELLYRPQLSHQDIVID